MLDLRQLARRLGPLLTVGNLARWWSARGRPRSPIVAGLMRLLHSKGVLFALLVIGMAVQVVLVVLVGLLVDLALDLMEVWLELAAKHLQITLDRS